MSEGNFTTVKVTFELCLYNGRLKQPITREDNFILYVRDEFTKLWLGESNLRTGEHMYVTDIEVQSP
jgi:hypothetical protein